MASAITVRSPNGKTIEAIDLSIDWEVNVRWSMVSDNEKPSKSQVDMIEVL